MTAGGTTPQVSVYQAAPTAVARAELGESPLWDSEGGLRWLDVPGRRLLTLDRQGRERSVALNAHATCIELGPGKDLFAVTPTGFAWVSHDSGRVNEIVAVLKGGTASMNDGAIDALGRCWAGSAVRDGSRRGNLYRFDEGGVSLELRHLAMSNGIDWSPGADVLYHVDSAAGTVMAWGYNLGAGQLVQPRLLRSVPADVGLPDGLTVDADGHVWLAVWGAGQVWRLDPRTGDTTAVVEVPTPYATSCAFGGEDLTTLYITTANHQRPPGGGLLYAVELPVRGRQPHRFTRAVS